MKEQKFEFGSRVKDQITGFEGIVRAVNYWDNGCVKYAVQGQVVKDGKIPECEWIDEQQLELIDAALKKEKKPTGGPMPIEHKPTMSRG
ncbi:MAG: hypothetical protein MUP27_08965 [Desulfobacterales bacterium]|nr:hypothetical protein [Desulfobacterales bacterium]